MGMKKKEMDDLYRFVVKNSFQGIMVLQEGRIRLVNPALCRFLGIPENKLISLPFTDLFRYIHPEERSVMRRRFQDRMQGKNVPDQYEFRVLLKKGEIRWIEIKISKVLYQSRAALHLFFNDITNRKINEELTQKSHLLLQNIIDSVPLPVYYLNRQGLFLGCNSAFERITGLSRNDIVGSTAFDIMPKKEARIFTGPISRILKQRKTGIREVLIRYADGTEHDVLLHKALFYEPGRRAAGFIGALLDITERKKYEQALEESEKKFSLAFEVSPLLLALVNYRTHRYAEVNQMFLDTLKYKREEVIGKSTVELAIFAEPKERDEALAIVEKEGRLKDFKVHIRTRENEIRTGIFSVQKLFLRDDQYLLTVMHDITELEKLQEQLIRSENLSVVGQLAAGIAHEFNNILTVIKGSVQLARLENQGAKDPQIREMLCTLENESEKAQAIISQMMAFSRPRVMQKRRLKVSEIIKEVIRIQEKQLALENISVLLDLPSPEENPVPADPNQLRQVFLNLFLNARHALKPKNQGTIRIVIRETPEQAVIVFSDNGIGMDEETQKRIFIPFFTTKGAYARNDFQIKGTGLGLPVCYTIIRQHNGTISFESRPDEGTSFTITLPRQPADASSVPEKESRPGETAPSPADRDLKILIIDDEKQILLILKKILCRLGYDSVTCTDSGEEALTLVKSKVYDVIFLDWLMPGTDGKQILKSVKETGIAAKIVLLTGKIDFNQRELEPFRIFRIIKKPFDIREIKEILEKTLNA